MGLAGGRIGHLADGDVVAGAQVQVDVAGRSCGECAHAAGHREGRRPGVLVLTEEGHDVLERVVTGEGQDRQLVRLGTVVGDGQRAGALEGVG